MRWPWQHHDKSDPEEKKQLERVLQQRDQKVRNLGRELHEMKDRNQFSAMVERALHGGAT